jgi:glycosyltransferase involved in cell wall biosynthesis
VVLHLERAISALEAKGREASAMTKEQADPRVSVVIATYNMARFLPEAIESILRQSFQDIEVIVVDDGSTDNTREVVAQFGSRVKYVWQENAGPSAACNRGDDIARGEYQLRLDADDVLMEGALEKMVSVMDDAPQVGFCYGQVRYMDEDGKELHLPRQWPERSGSMTAQQVILELLNLRFIFGSATLFRRACFREVGRFDESLDYGEDTELYARMAKRFSAAYIAEPLAWRRKHRGAATAKLELDRQELSWLKILEGAGEPSPFGLSQRRLAFYAYLALARQAYGAGMPKTRRYLIKALAHRWPWLATRDGLDAIVLFVKSLLPQPVRTFGAKLKGPVRV